MSRLLSAVVLLLSASLSWGAECPTSASGPNAQAIALGNVAPCTVTSLLPANVSLSNNAEYRGFVGKFLGGLKAEEQYNPSVTITGLPSGSTVTPDGAFAGAFVIPDVGQNLTINPMYCVDNDLGAQECHSHVITVGTPVTGGSGDLSTTITLQADSAIAANSTEDVVVGLPIANGDVQTLSEIRVRIGGVEQAVHVAQGMTWIGSGDIRNVVIGLDNVDMSGGNVTLTIDDEGAAVARLTAAVTPGTFDAGSTKANVTGRRIWGVHDRDYLAASGIVPPYTPGTVSDAAGSFQSRQFDQWAGLLNYSTSTRAEWLFDRSSAMYKAYLSTGDAKFLREAYLSKQFYYTHVRNDGTAPTQAGGDGCWLYGGGSCSDGKYIYTQSAKLAWALNGDTTQWTNETIIEMAQQADLGWNQWHTSDPYDSELEGFTERAAGIVGQTEINAYEMTQEPSLLVTMTERIDMLKDLQQTEKPWDIANGWVPKSGAYTHSWKNHEGSATPAVEGDSDDRRFSPWMSENVASFLWQVYHVTGRSDIPEMLRQLGNAIDLYGFSSEYVSGTGVNSTYALRSGYERGFISCNGTDSNQDTAADIMYAGSAYAAASVISANHRGNGFTNTHNVEVLLPLVLAYNFETDTARRTRLEARMAHMYTQWTETAVDDCADEGAPNGGGNVLRLWSWQHAGNSLRTYEHYVSAPIATGPEISVSDVQNNDTYNFASVSEGSPDQSKTFTISNAGQASLTLGTATITGSDCAIDGQPASSVAASGSTTLVVSCDASTAGTKTGDVSFSTNDSDENPFVIGLSLVVTASANEPEIDFAGYASGASRSFGTADTGSSAPTLNFTAQNNGAADATFGTCTVSAPFSVTQQPAATVLATESTDITVSMPTGTAGTFNGTLSCPNNDADENPYTISLSGTVQDPPPPGNLAFSDIGASSFNGTCPQSNNFGVSMPDLNADGWPDVLANSHASGGNRIHCWVTSNGDGTFTVRENSASGPNNSQLGNESGGWTDQIVDVNGDLKPDVLMRGNEPGQSLWTNTSTVGGLPSFTASTLPGSQQGSRFLIADFDGDGSMDVWMDEAAAVFDIGTGATIASVSFGGLAGLLHLNSDSHPDVLGEAGVYYSDGDGTFTPATISAFSVCQNYPQLARNADIDQDGDLDVVCAAPRVGSNEIHAIRNDGGGSWTRLATNIQEFSYSDYRGAQVTKGGQDWGDLDNDMLPDFHVAWAKSSTGNGPRVYRYTGSGSFDMLNGNNIGLATYDSQNNQAVAFEDYDLDGRLDVASIQMVGAYGTVEVFRNTTVNTNTWLKVTLDGRNMGAGDNGFAIGAVVKVYDAGGAYINSCDNVGTYKVNREATYIHCALGSHTGNVDYEVVWPSGFEASQKFTNVPSNTIRQAVYVQGGNDTESAFTPGSGY